MQSAAGRAFVFLATLGQLLPSGGRRGEVEAGMPPAWASCLRAPERDTESERARCFATAVILPAFAQFAREVASPLPDPPPALLPSVVQRWRWAAAADAADMARLLSIAAAALLPRATGGALQSGPAAAPAVACDSALETGTGLLPQGLLDE